VCVSRLLRWSYQLAFCYITVLFIATLFLSFSSFRCSHVFINRSMFILALSAACCCTFLRRLLLVYLSLIHITGILSLDYHFLSSSLIALSLLIVHLTLSCSQGCSSTVAITLSNGFTYLCDTFSYPILVLTYT